MGLFLVQMMFVGLVYPLTAAFFGACFCVGSVIYMEGYKLSPDKRIAGGVWPGPRVGPRAKARISVVGVFRRATSATPSVLTANFHFQLIKHIGDILIFFPLMKIAYDMVMA